MMQRGKLKPEDEESITKYYVDLKENIDALNVIDYLFQVKVITLDEKEAIQGEKPKSKRNETLLNIILNAGPGDAFERFLESLRNQYSHLKIVKERYNNIQTKENEGYQKEQTVSYGSVKMKTKIFDLAVLIVGETGTNTNTILKTIRHFQKVQFQSNGIAKIEFDGRCIQFVDSPNIDIFTEDTEKLITEATESIETISEGFHAVFLVIKYRSKMVSRYFEQFVERLKSLYGPTIVKNYCILVVSYKDNIEKEHFNFPNWCNQQEGAFAKLYAECGQRAVLMNKKTENVSILEDQMKTLIENIENLLFDGRRYTFQQFNEAENGRRRMKIEDKKGEVLKEIMSKCKDILQSSKNFEDCTDKYIVKLQSLIEELLKIKQDVQLLDEGTHILSHAIFFVDDLHSLLTQKKEELKNNEICKEKAFITNQRKENRLLKKIAKFEKLKQEEDEKFKLQKEIIQLKEDNLSLKLKLREDAVLNMTQSSELTKINCKTQIAQHFSKECKESDKSFEIQLTAGGPPLQNISNMTANTESSTIRKGNSNDIQPNIQDDYSVHVHVKGNYTSISILVQWIVLFSLVSMVVVGNSHRYELFKDNYLTGVKPDIESIKDMIHDTRKYTRDLRDDCLSKISEFKQYYLKLLLEFIDADRELSEKEEQIKVLNKLLASKKRTFLKNILKQNNPMNFVLKKQCKAI